MEVTVAALVTVGMEEGRRSLPSSGPLISCPMMAMMEEVLEAGMAVTLGFISAMVITEGMAQTVSGARAESAASKKERFKTTIGHPVLGLMVQMAKMVLAEEVAVRAASTPAPGSTED